MPADESWRGATKAQYDDDTNLAARQAVFAYLVEADPFPAPLGDFSVTAGQTVLDVGCGNGMFLAGACNAGATGIGLDTSPGMLVAAAASAPTARLLLGDAVALPIADDGVDVAMALWMLYHVEDKPAAVAELRRVTRQTGYAVATANTAGRSFLDELVCASLGSVLGRTVDRWIPALGFDDENGADILGTAFDDVETHLGGHRFEFTDAEVVVRYVASMLDAIEAQNGPFDHRALLTEVGGRTSAEIADGGAVSMAQRRAVFICR